MLAGKLGADGCQERRPDHDTERVGRDEVARFRSTDVQALFHLLEQPHHGEFGDADAESAHREGHDGQGDVAGSGLRLDGAEGGREGHWPAFRKFWFIGDLVSAKHKI